MAAPTKDNAKRMCAYTFVVEGIPDEEMGYDGSILLRCAQCKLQCYKDQAAQKSHWPLHKASCKQRKVSAEELKKYEERLRNLGACFGELKPTLGHPDGAAETPHNLRKIRTLMDDGADDQDDHAFTMHTFARQILFAERNVMVHIMAVPGMVPLMLGAIDQKSAPWKEDLLTKQNRILKEMGYNHRPQDTYIRDHIKDAEEKKRVQALCKQYDRLNELWEPKSAMNYCFLYFNLLLCGAIQANPSSSSAHDGNGVIRGCNDEKSHEYRLAIACLRRAFELYSDPLVLDSCGDAMAPGGSLVFMALKHFHQHGGLGGKHCQAEEVVPGLTLSACVKTCIRELQQAIAPQYSVKTLKLISQQPQLWTALGISVEQRASVILALLQYIEDNMHGGNDNFNFSSVDPPLKECNLIFLAACGLCKPPHRDIELVKEVWKKAWEEGEKLGPDIAGNNIDYRVFLMFLDSQGKYAVADVVKEFKQFDEIPSMGSRHAKNYANKSFITKKEEILKQLQGERLYNEERKQWRK